jgi:3'-phosphoadenosine 5'-phosphosulfate sulfotransferase (PAPS reductase)/FAD synthetase
LFSLLEESPTGPVGGGADWVIGLPDDQSAHRRGFGIIADSRGDLLKLNPQFGWTCDQAAYFAAENGIPINPLDAVGVFSIRCAACIVSRVASLARSAWWPSAGQRVPAKSTCAIGSRRELSGRRDIGSKTDVRVRP